MHPKKAERLVAHHDFGIFSHVGPGDQLARAEHIVRAALQGSFSAVSKPKLANKYAFESSRRDLHNELLCTVLESNAPFSRLNFLFLKIAKKIAKFCEISLEFIDFRADFYRNFTKSCRTNKKYQILKFAEKF